MSGLSAEAFSSGIAASWQQLAFVLWIAVGLLSGLDGRRSVSATVIVLLLICGAASVQGWAASDWIGLEGAWLVSTATSGLALMFNVRVWLSTTPAAMHQEATGLPSSETISPGAAREPVLYPEPTSMSSFSWQTAGLALIGIGASSFAVAYPWWEGSGSWQPGLGLGTLATASRLTAAAMLACGLVSSLELTYLGSPDALVFSTLRSLNWRWVARLTATLFAAHILLSLWWITRPINELQSWEIQAVGRIFVLTQTLACFVGWMVPHRLAKFQRQHVAPRGWTSLTLAAWLATLSLSVVLALPADWPWRLAL